MAPPTETLTVEAPSRLHLGMFAFGEGHQRQFGGVGLMIREPRLRLCVTRADRFTCDGLHAERAERIARQVADRWLGGALPKCTLAITSAPPEHVGLGLGTQLSLSVGIALTHFSNLDRPPSTEEIAVSLGRARRSSVGTHGFIRGGLIVDAGHAPGETLGPLLHRVELPERWRIVLIVPRGSDGLSGSREADAFGELPPVPRETASELHSEVMLHLLPAAQCEDFAVFSESIFRFGRLAGECFASVQGGPYAAAAKPAVARLRELGVAGIAQSSWGPTVLALTKDDEAAGRLVRQLENDPVARGCDLIVSPPDNRGAVGSAFSRH
jgi:beta-RFAP synthase